MAPVRLVVTTGDPRGIGPEVVRAALTRLDRTGTEVHLLGLPLPDTPADHVEVTGPFDGSEASAGRVSLRAIERAVERITRGEADALVTGPIHKRALRAAGAAEPGHTELLQRLTGVSAVGMLMAAESTVVGGPLRVLLATTHLPLREVPERLTPAVLESGITLLDHHLRQWWGLPAPRLALCALNPHASDGGLFGDEESRIMEPVVARLRAAGVDVAGPFPADTVFVRALAGRHDAVVAPYHDVGMAAFKTAAFGRGVNVTLGLPFPRTSPDHGTAFDIAGTGAADPSSMTEALDLAIRLARPLRSA